MQEQPDPDKANGKPSPAELDRAYVLQGNLAKKFDQIAPGFNHPEAPVREDTLNQFRIGWGYSTTSLPELTQSMDHALEQLRASDEQYRDAPHWLSISRITGHRTLPVWPLKRALSLNCIGKL